MEWAGGAGLRDVAGDGSQLEVGELPEIQGDGLRAIRRSVAAADAREAQRGHLRDGHDQVIELRGSPGDLVFLDVVLVGKRLPGGGERGGHRAREDDVSGGAGHAGAPEGDDQLWV